MQLYWRFGSVPELAGLSKQDRRQIVKLAARKDAERGWFTSFNIVFFLCVGASVVVAGRIVADRLLNGEILEGFAWFVGSIAAIGVTVVVFIRPWAIARLRPHIREVLAAG